MLLEETAQPAPVLVLDQVRIFPRHADAPATRLIISDGIIQAAAPDAPIPAGARTIDCRGMVALPALGDVHGHIDSNRFDLPFRPHTSDRTLPGLIENDVTNWPKAEKSITWRTHNALRRIIASGGTRVRSHAQVDPRSGLRRFEAVAAARATYRDYLDMQIVAFPQLGIIRDAGRGSVALMREAIANGADLIGGIDPCGLDRDPRGHLDAIFGLAEATGAGIDLHLHERGTLGAFTLELVAERTHALGMHGKVTISHAMALCSQASDAAAQRLIDLLAEHDIAVTTIAPPGAILPWRQLRSAGVRMGLGQDGMRDYWSPFGDGDVLGRVWQAAFVGNEAIDADIEELARIGSYGAQSLLDGADYQVGCDVLAVGEAAEILLVPGETLTSVVMDRPRERTVIHRGRVTVDGGVVVGDPGAAVLAGE